MPKECTVKQNSLKAWILAARPKTLTGAIAPVLVGIALAYAVLGKTIVQPGHLIPAVLCLLFAILMQIDANLINDYYDFKRGADNGERLGPERACVQGWITMRAMWAGIVTVTVIACLAGLPLVYYGGWGMLIVGALCVLGAFLYTTRFSYNGLGDVMVVIFFGIIPVLITFHVITFDLTAALRYPAEYFLYFLYILKWGGMAVVAGLGMGLVVNNLLIVNNYRDRVQDLKNGKMTLVVAIGEKATDWLYLINGILGVGLMIFVLRWLQGFFYVPPEAKWWLSFPYYLVIPLLFLPFLFSAHRNMVRINHGRELNAVLGQTARNILIYSLLFVLSIVVTILVA